MIPTPIGGSAILGLEPFHRGTWQDLPRRNLRAQHSHPSAMYVSPRLNLVETSRITTHLGHLWGSNLDQECRLDIAGESRDKLLETSEIR
jgi:hypothetical protein